MNPAHPAQQAEHALILREDDQAELLDPVITRPTWTAVVFHHEGMGQAMKGLFEDYWRRGRAMSAAT